MHANHYAAIVSIVLLLGAQAGRSQDLAGEWATQGYSARVRIAPCERLPELLCGEIIWLWEPYDEDGNAVLDKRNPSVELRQRSLIGLPLLKNFRRQDNSRWIGGSIYDPESGRTYDATLTLASPDMLRVSGCLLFICRTQTWRRASSMCSMNHVPIRPGLPFNSSRAIEWLKPTQG